MVPNQDFSTFKVKMGINGLGNELFQKHDIFIFETDDTRHK
jgi:hypothetical protein